MKMCLNNSFYFSRINNYELLKTKLAVSRPISFRGDGYSFMNFVVVVVVQLPCCNFIFRIT